MLQRLALTEITSSIKINTPINTISITNALRTQGNNKVTGSKIGDYGTY